jgi:hypothetical protein
LCSAPLEETFVDLGSSPLANAFLTEAQLEEQEPTYPLHVWVCSACTLVQLEELAGPTDIFGEDYAYFSSFSDTWLQHAAAFVSGAVERFGLGSGSQVVEVASNDGYLLQYVHARGIPALGIEPSRNVAEAAMAKGLSTEVAFFGRATAERLAARGLRADLLIGNNVLAHTPDVHDFVSGIPLLLAEGGVVAMEFPHLLRLVEHVQFDTIYHEHYSYLSLRVVERLFREHGLRLFDVEQLPTHGGSLRVYACRSEVDRPEGAGLAAVRHLEAAAGLANPASLRGFGARVAEVKRGLLAFLHEQRDRGLSVAGYGAPAKGNTLLNACGVGPDLLPYTVDRSPHKQGRWLPGSRIPVLRPEAIRERRPRFVLVLPWNLREEIMEQLAYVRAWGGRFVTAIPEVRIYG